MKYKGGKVREKKEMVKRDGVDCGSEVGDYCKGRKKMEIYIRRKGKTERARADRMGYGGRFTPP